MTGVRRIVRRVEKDAADAQKAALRDPKAGGFAAPFAAAARVARRRLPLEREMLHVPPFLIASITCACRPHRKTAFLEAKLRSLTNPASFRMQGLSAI